jgi:hypothetical protein
MRGSRKRWLKKPSALSASKLKKMEHVNYFDSRKLNQIKSCAKRTTASPKAGRCSLSLKRSDESRGPESLAPV